MSIYTRFTADDIVEANPTTITTGLWSGDTGSLYGSTAYLYSTQVTGNSGDYYLDVYNLDPATNELAEVQFAMTYGHINGGGAPTLDVSPQSATLPTKAIYSQYRNLLLDPSDAKFSFNGVDSDHIYVINLQRARVKEQLDPGNWQLPLSGANGYRTFIDDSGQTLGALTANSKAGRVFNVVSGSITGTSGVVTASINGSSWGGVGYGLVYPDLGIIVLNPAAICPAAGFFINSAKTFTGSFASSSVTTPLYTSTAVLNLVTAEGAPYAPVTHSLASWNSQNTAYNTAGLFAALRNAINDGSNELQFRARSAETISSTHYFVRLRNKEYNYSNNPTFYDPDTGALVQSDFKNDPKVYITTVGLYNDQNELLSVAKLSKPLRKSYDEEVLVRIRLDF